MHDRQLRVDNPLLQKVDPARRAFEQERCAFNAAQLADRRKSEAERRNELLKKALVKDRIGEGSRMVKKDKPHPELRPGPGLAHSVDRAVHFARLDHERTEAKRSMAIPSRDFGAAARDAFKAQRSAQNKNRSRDRDR